MLGVAIAGLVTTNLATAFLSYFMLLEMRRYARAAMVVVAPVAAATLSATSTSSGEDVEVEYVRPTGTLDG